MKKLFAVFLSIMFFAGCLCSTKSKKDFTPKLLKSESKEKAVEPDIYSPVIQEEMPSAPDENEKSEKNLAEAAPEDGMPVPAQPDISSSPVLKEDASAAVEEKKDEKALSGGMPAVKAGAGASAYPAGKKSCAVNFAFDSSSLTQKNKDTIAMFSGELKEGDYKVTVSVHTDSTGSREYNQKLSERRARSVKEELVKNGIDETRIKVTGYGEDKPKADNATSKGRAKNRRAEIYAEIY